eukprot:9481498-Pyramimonas_sp.AAC.1
MLYYAVALFEDVRMLPISSSAFAAVLQKCWSHDESSMSGAPPRKQMMESGQNWNIFRTSSNIIQHCWGTCDKRTTCKEHVSIISGRNRKAAV